MRKEKETGPCKRPHEPVLITIITFPTDAQNTCKMFCSSRYEVHLKSHPAVSCRRLLRLTAHIITSVFIPIDVEKKRKKKNSTSALKVEPTRNYSPTCHLTSGDRKPRLGSTETPDPENGHITKSTGRSSILKNTPRHRKRIKRNDSRGNING